MNGYYYRPAAPIDLYFGTEYEKVIEKQIYSTVMRACRKARFLLLRKVYQKGDRLLFSAFEKRCLSPFCFLLLRKVYFEG